MKIVYSSRDLRAYLELREVYFRFRTEEFWI